MQRYVKHQQSPWPCRANGVLQALTIIPIMVMSAAPVAWAADASTSSAPRSSASARSVGNSGLPAGDACAPATPAVFSSVTAARGGAADAGAEDPAAVWVSCSLPYATGKPGGDCTGRHTLQIQTSSPTGKVTAELMALNTDGSLLKSALVKQGDTIEMASRVSSSDWKFTSNKNQHAVFAPVPLVKVTFEDKGEKAEAFCSNIPWVDVLQPSGGVTTESGGGEVDVLAAVPLTNPATLQVLVDGDNLLSDVPDYTNCTVATPCSGTADINGATVAYSNLIVDIAPSVTALASNTVRVTLDDLSCGGHFVRVTTTKLPGTLRQPGTNQCNIDDLTDKGAASVFEITITEPLAGVATLLVPTPVKGEACGGSQITDVNINGKTLSVAGQTFLAGDGETTGDVYKVLIDTTLAQTDLVGEVLQGQTKPLGTLDAGSNRLVASAKEIGGSRTYERFIFATGNVAPIGVDPSAAVFSSANAAVFQEAALQDAVNQQLKTMVEGQVQGIMSSTTTELQNAFVVGLSAEGVQTLFNKLCVEPNPAAGNKTIGQIFSEALEGSIGQFTEANPFSSFEFDPPCFVCNPTVRVFVSSVDVGTDVTCPVVFEDGFFTVTMNLPDISVTVKAGGHCKDTEDVFGEEVCLSEVTVDYQTTLSVTDISLKFAVTEHNLLNLDTSAPSFFPGATIKGTDSGGVNFGCIGGASCVVVEAIVKLADGLLNIFGVDVIPDLFNDISDLNLVDFETQIMAAQPDPVKLNEIKVDETVVANFDQKMSGAVSEVNITADGITAGLKGTFATTVLDTDVEGTPGITLTPAPVPSMGAMRAQGAKDALIGLSDDSINMMFASLTAGGKLKPSNDPQGCVDTGATVGNLLPVDCETLNVGDALATAAAQGYCHAIKGDACGTLAGADAFLTSTEQGACYGAQGAVCSEIANFDLVRFGACSLTPNFNLKATQPLLFCAKGDVPPRMLFPDGGTPGGSVPSALRLNDLSVALVIDRTENHLADGPLNDAPSCFAGNTAADCNVFAACLDLNLNFSMQFLTCGDGKPGFKSTFDSIQLLNREVGVVCSGATSPTSDADILQNASDDDITIPLGQNAGQLSPDICGAGLDLGGFVTCAFPQILSIEADGSPNLRDYLGITCKIQ